MNRANPPGAVLAAEYRQLCADEVHRAAVERSLVFAGGNPPRGIALELHLPGRSLPGHLTFELDVSRQVIGFVLGARLELSGFDEHRVGGNVLHGTGGVTRLHRSIERFHDSNDIFVTRRRRSTPRNRNTQNRNSGCDESRTTPHDRESSIGLATKGTGREVFGEIMEPVAFSHGARDRLTRHDLGRFPGDTLFDKLGRVVCGVGKLPRKELFEAWEVARRVRRWRRGGRIVDVAGGHGLLAHAMLLLDDTSPEALVVDPNVPPSSTALHAAIVAEWPRLRERVTFVPRDIREFPLTSSDVVVSSHACGGLTDVVLDAAASARAAVAVLPCCHDLDRRDAGALTGWLDGAMAVDVLRATRLEAKGYHVRTQTIPSDITPKNRLLIGLA
jgi:hypothetical protein